MNAQREVDSGESECRSVMDRIGQYPRRKAADFRMVSREKDNVKELNLW